MDHAAISASVFDKLADRYREKFMDVTLYDACYREFCALLKPGRARVLDAACGPGNVSRYLLSQRPELELLGIDLAPRMVEIAGEAVPSARFAVHDCRRLADLQLRFDGIICAFGLPYLSEQEASEFITSASLLLDPKGVLFLSTMLGKADDSGPQCCSSGDEVHVTYHSEHELLRSLQRCGFSVIKQTHILSPSTAAKKTNDLILIATK
jgi:2-polyprenyl-3-methyl-5-hydroxy-6-metoxy-1,4-benzoquinol methylase